MSVDQPAADAKPVHTTASAAALCDAAAEALLALHEAVPEEWCYHNGGVWLGGPSVARALTLIDDVTTLPEDQPPWPYEDWGPSGPFYGDAVNPDAARLVVTAKPLAGPLMATVLRHYAVRFRVGGSMKFPTPHDDAMLALAQHIVDTAARP